jgi:hypothetical protein
MAHQIPVREDRRGVRRGRAVGEEKGAIAFAFGFAIPMISNLI